MCVPQETGEDLKDECPEIECGSGSCNGVGACGFDPAGTVCRVAAGVCDAEETCSGISATCPADLKLQGICRSIAGPCDLAEYCNGVSNDCPANQFHPNTYECRPDSGICDVADFCTGSSADCPNTYEPAGTPCNDGLFCTVTDHCQGELCIGTGSPCAGQVCDEELDACVGCLDDSNCDDGKPCTIDRCIDNNCNFTELEPSSTICRQAVGPCDVAEYCTGIFGDCPGDVHEPNGTSCDDGLYCNGTDTCTGGVCQSSGYPCSEPTPVCDEATDACVDCYNSSHCNDNNPCTIDTCVANQCTYANAPDTTVCRQVAGPCDVEERCTGTSPDCPADGYEQNGTSCNDGLYCTSGDECNNGICGGPTDTCPGQGCNELTDECSMLVALINTPPDGTIIHFGESIDFTGCGTPEGTEVGDYSWRLGDPENGYELSSNKNFSTNQLQVGEHTIYLRVKDLYEELWSAPDSVTVTVEEALGLPDLALSRSDIKFFNASEKEIQQAADGEPVTIQATIHNISINDTQYPVTVYVYDGDAVNGILIGYDTIEEVIEGDPLGKDETAKTATINWLAIGDTYKVITVKIEYGYPEATLQNNQASRLLIVGDPSGTCTMAVDGSVSKLSPCYGDTITVSGTATYDWLGIPVMGAEVTVEVWEYAENGQFYSTVQGRTTAPYGNYCISFDAPSQNIEYVITTRVNDGFLTGTDTNDVFQPDPCPGSDIYDLSCSAPSLEDNVFYLPCPGFSNTKTYTNSLVAVSGQITNSGNQDFLNPDGFDVEFHSGYPFTPENLICSQRIDEVTYPEIAIGQSILVSCPEGWIPSTAGTYNIYMKIFLNDQNSNNNQKSKPIQVYAERVDLRPYRYSGCTRVTGISFSEQCIVKGDPITITCNVYNGGIDSSGTFEVRFYSGDPDGCCGQQIGSPVYVPSIPAGGYAQPQVQWDTSLFEGDEEIFVKVDIPNAVSEYDENNNKTSARCYVHPTTADLYVGSVSFSNYAPNPGDLINISARIDNNGGSISDPTYVDFYVGDPDGSGVHTGEPVSVPGIEPCGNATVTLPNWEVPQVGSHYIYAKLYSNGRKNFRLLQVYPEPQPDLSIYSEDILISSGQHILGNPINFLATVHNQSSIAAATNPRIYFYIGGIPDPLDIAIVSSIPASASTPVPCNNAWIPAIEGFYEVGVELEPAFPQTDVNFANNWATTSFCVSTAQDQDADSALGICDNCPDQPNGQLLGTCVRAMGSPPFNIIVGVGSHLTTCAADTACNYQAGEFCQLSQGDSNNNGIGDACECYADVNCSTKVDLADLVIMKAEFLRTDCATNPCSADCNGDHQVNLTDLVVMKTQFLRNGCPACP